MHILSTQPIGWHVQMLKLRLRYTQPMSPWMVDQPRVSTWNSIREKMENPIWKYHFFTILFKTSKFKSNNLITRNNIYINLQDFVWKLKINSKMWDFSKTWLVYRPALGRDLVPFNYTATINFFCRFCMLSSQPTVVVSVYIILSYYLTYIKKKDRWIRAK